MRQNGWTAVPGDVAMHDAGSCERMVETEVTYTLEVNGKCFIIQHVPARVCPETGEQYFSPETVEALQKKVWGKKGIHPCD